MSQTKAQLIDTLVASLLPASDSAVDIGSNAVRFANIYGDTLYGNGANLTGINTDLVSDTSPQLGGNLDTNGNAINLPDSNGTTNRISVGTGSDLKILHDGSNSYFASDDLRIVNNVLSESQAVFLADGAVELYYDNSKKFETTSAGATVSGTLAVTSNLNMTGYIKVLNDQPVYFGTSNQLNIVGTASEAQIITDGTTDLVIKDANHTSAIFDTSAEVQLYYDNSKKFETTSTGVTVSGNIDIGGNDFNVADNGQIHLGDSTDLRIFHNGSDSVLQDTGTGDLLLISSTVQIKNAANNETLAKFIQDGGVELYHDNYKNFEVFEDGCAFDNDANNMTIYLKANNDTKGYIFATAGDEIGFKTASNEWAVRVDSDAEVALYYDGSTKLETTSNGISVTGQVSVGGTHLNYLGNGNNYITQNDSGFTYFRNSSGTVRTTILQDGDWRWGDGYRIQLGNGDDLQIYHNGTHSYLDNATGKFHIRNNTGTYNGNGIHIQALSNEEAIVCNPNAAVDLYYDNTKMLSTESRGAIIQKSGSANLIIGSTNAGGANIFLDGDSNGDGNGGDYCGVRGTSDGHLVLFADNPSTNGIIYFQTGNSTDRWFMESDGHFKPNNNNAYDIGSANLRVRNIYTNDLNLSNEGSSNDVDGTWGSYTIQEGAEDLFLVNKRSGKKYKFALTEVS